MRRLEIIVEGQTEVEFVKNIIAPYFLKGDVLVSPICIRTSPNHRGGMTNYELMRNDIIASLRSKNQELVVSMFVDYFRIPQKRMPGYELWKDERDHYRQALLMEKSIFNDINDRRFVPYIQMHEFESLLFSSSAGFEKYWDADKVTQVCDIVSKFSNPENINTSPDGAPSKRLLNICPEYQKSIDGNIIALEVGFDEMLKKCPKFATWISELSQRTERVE